MTVRFVLCETITVRFVIDRSLRQVATKTEAKRSYINMCIVRFKLLFSIRHRKNNVFLKGALLCVEWFNKRNTHVKIFILCMDVCKFNVGWLFCNVGTYASNSISLGFNMIETTSRCLRTVKTVGLSFRVREFRLIDYRNIL